VAHAHLGTIEQMSNAKARAIAQRLESGFQGEEIVAARRQRICLSEYIISQSRCRTSNDHATAM
jgi:hypothetical protein